MEKEHKEFLDEYDKNRQSGATNMWGAGEELQGKFGLDKNQAKKILQEWIEEFFKN